MEKMERCEGEACKVVQLKASSSPSTSKFPLTFWEVAMASGIVASFAVGLLGVYLTMPASDYSFLKLPRTLEDLQILRDHLESYTSDYTAQVLIGYCVVYIFMQTFMIPGTIFMSLLAGALFGVFKGMALVMFAATAGASSCYFLSKLIGRPLVFSLWPDKLTFFQTQVAKRKESLLNYMLFLRVTPTLPNTFINVASPIVDVPYHIFFFGTIIGIIPAAFVTVRAGLALGELRSLGDLYDFQSIATLFLIGIVSVTPAQQEQVIGTVCWLRSDSLGGLDLCTVDQVKQFTMQSVLNIYILYIEVAATLGCKMAGFVDYRRIIATCRSKRQLFKNGVTMYQFSLIFS